ncbi:DUF6694 family lipoprotein [Shewanella algae]|uniref:DUF6694 family lipoprotein n=1 Tax=Shewanella algae TaxID=38313 RepID=UPI0011824FF5|nr:DUF6694 family lipoprotein [Shewanella algae]EKT4489164.1 hypothetical protein [Shewanella algae]MBO2548216.1 hypothetical protein [Shewanella algae]MBO2626633.1 hypothetical protein [Shewanella algae]TVO80570.1 hypothetical protein AYI78_18900 [Shewanella algae]TVO91093.1 hypothetical protein AYI79_19325 [Shewanella algae]
MKNIILISLVLVLSGCFGPAKFDSSSEASIKESTKKIVESLPESNREEFQKALMYFSIGGESGLKAMMGAAFAGTSPDVTNEAMFAANLKAIDGLTGEEILNKYRSNIEQDRIKREKEEAERKKVTALKKEAEKLLDGNNFEEALAKYKALSEISSGVEAAETGIEKTTKAMEEFTEKMNYMDKVEITEFVAQRIDTYLKKDVPAVRISLKNNGDRSLDKVKVVVYFKGKGGNTIFEEDYHPVLVSKYSFSGDNKPLKPGYVKEMEKGKYYTLESALSDWQEGEATAKVVDIEFTK